MFLEFHRIESESKKKLSFWLKKCLDCWDYKHYYVFILLQKYLHRVKKNYDINLLMIMVDINMIDFGIHT